MKNLNQETKHKEHLVEVFSSMQGEGKYVGCRQVFIRFASCNLHCRYCDTEFLPQNIPSCRFEDESGTGLFTFYPNPVDLFFIVEKIKKLFLTTKHQALSLTGGEPLLHTGAIAYIAKNIKLPLLLETNGTLVEELQSVLPYIDIISMDIKLPSTSGHELFSIHQKFLQVAKIKDVYVKLVVSSRVTDAEFLQAVKIIQEVGRKIPLYIQPLTTSNKEEKITAKKTGDLQLLALQYLEDVRIVPQTHVFLGQL